jgi:hypothetical protein
MLAASCHEHREVTEPAPGEPFARATRRGRGRQPPQDRDTGSRFAFGSCGKSTPRGGSTHELEEEASVADRRYGGISFGGIIVIVGIVLMFVWSFWIGLIITLIGLIAFGGLARGKWY